MSYVFPRITSLNQVLEAIKGRDEFVVKHDKENGYIVVNYLINFEDTFPPVVDERTAILRECRGITFDAKTQKVVSRKFHKFFNLGERPETQLDRLDFTKPHRILWKRDGSMLTPLMVDGNVRWCTKMGMTGVAKPVEEFTSRHSEYEQMARAYMAADHTPIFEWCSRQQRIVIDYPEDQLVLLAVRDNETGAYLPYDQLVEAGAQYGIPVIESYSNDKITIKELMAQIRDLKGAEGVIIRWDDGHMVKMKGEEYLLLHKTLDMMRFEKDVIRLILDEKVDDAKPGMSDDLKNRVDRFQHAVWANINKLADDLYWIAQAAHDNLNGSKKRFALETVPGHKNVSGILFKVWDNLDQGVDGARGFIIREMLDSTGSQGKVDAARHLIGGIRWNDFYFVTEE